MVICNKFRNLTGGLSEIQAKIILIRGFTEEDKLLYQIDFSKLLRRPLSTVNYNIQVLKKKGYLTKLNFLTPDGKLVFQKLKEYLNNTKKLRGHKAFGEFILFEPYKDFEKVRNKYTLISKSSKHRGFRLQFKDCIILFYSPKKVCFYLPGIYADSIPEIYAEAYERYIQPLINYLEQMFPGLKVNQYEIATLTLNHVALQNHALAEAFKQFNVRYSSDRLEVDHSHGVAELETVHKKYAVEDMDKILTYEEVIRGGFHNGKSKKL
jgi:hypothetical protein